MKYNKYQELCKGDDDEVDQHSYVALPARNARWTSDQRSFIILQPSHGLPHALLRLRYAIFGPKFSIQPPRCALSGFTSPDVRGGAGLPPLILDSGTGSYLSCAGTTCHSGSPRHESTIPLATNCAMSSCQPRSIKTSTTSAEKT